MKPLKQFIKNIPIIGQALSYLKRYVFRNHFKSSTDYWIKRYKNEGTSGAGSYGELAQYKANVLNKFVSEHNIQTVIEFGCGDGNQLTLAEYPEYMGFDVSPQALALCKQIFSSDNTKKFKSMSEYTNETSELSLSLDVIYHLVEDGIYEQYMQRLFDAAKRFVIIYSSNMEQTTEYPHIRHRKFSSWIEDNRPEWRLQTYIPNKHPFTGDENTGSWADFYIYSRTT